MSTLTASPLPIAKRPRGRPRLPSLERREHHRASKKAWAGRNLAYVRTQILALGTRPEYVERRRMLRHEREAALRARSDPSSEQAFSLSTMENPSD